MWHWQHDDVTSGVPLCLWSFASGVLLQQPVGWWQESIPKNGGHPFPARAWQTYHKSELYVSDVFPWKSSIQPVLKSNDAFRFLNLAASSAKSPLCKLNSWIYFQTIRKDRQANSLSSHPQTAQYSGRLLHLGFCPASSLSLPPNMTTT